MAHEYDNAFRTMEMDCPKLLIPVVNEVFHTNYSMDDEVMVLPNEQMITTPEDEQQIRITDSNFMVIGNKKDRYHIECESNPKSKELQIRIFQYDSQIALENRHFKDGVLHVRLPKSAVLYLRHNEKTPENLQMVIEDSGQKIYRNIPVIKVQMYSIEEIFKKNLLFFLPFHIFVHEKELALYNKDEEKRKLLLNEYEVTVSRIEQLCKDGKISERDKHCIITSMREVLKLIAKNKRTVFKEVDKIMGGEVLQYEAKTIYNEGKSDGRIEGVNDVLTALVEAGEISEEVAKLHREKEKQRHEVK